MAKLTRRRRRRRGPSQSDADGVLRVPQPRVLAAKGAVGTALKSARLATGPAAYLAADPSNCMKACYIGDGALLGADRRKAIETAVAQKDAANPRVNLDHVVTMMETMEATGAAGAPYVMEQTVGTTDWDIHPDSVIETILNQNDAVPGYYFFGLSAVSGYHRLMFMLSNRDPANPYLYLLDETGQFNNRNLYGLLGEVLEAFAAKARKTHPKLSPLRSEIWPIYPAPGTLLKLD